MSDLPTVAVGLASSYASLPVGYSFPASHYTVSLAQAQAYLEATQDDSALYHELSGQPEEKKALRIVPPLAIAALTLREMMATLPLDPGTVHMSQDYTFHAPVVPDTNLIAQVTITNKSQRRGVIIMTIRQTVVTEGNAPVLTGVAMLMIPVETPTPETQTTTSV